MPSPSLLHYQTNGRNWNEEEPPQRPLRGEHEYGGSEHTLLEREVADIIISLLYQQGSDSGRRFFRRRPRSATSDFLFPRWILKRKRSVYTPAHALTSDGGDDNGEPFSISSSSTMVPSSLSTACKENSDAASSHKKSIGSIFVVEEPQAAAPASDHGCPNVVEVYFHKEIPERGLLFWPGSEGGGNRKFVVPDLNMSAEDLVAVPANTELRRSRHEIYERAVRRLAAAGARRRRRELQKLKNSITADAPLCSRVR